MSLSESEEADELLLGTNGSPYPPSHKDDDLATLVAPAIHGEQELYFPPAELGSPTPTTYAEYDPYSLDPPRLGGGSSEYARAKKYAAFGGGGTYGPAASVWESEKKPKWRGLGLGRVVGFGKKGGNGGNGTGTGTGNGGFEAGMGKGKMEGQGPLLGAFVFEE